MNPLADPRSTHYAVLGVSPGDLTTEALRAARRGLMLLYHPDRNEAPEAHAFAARVNLAYSTLSALPSRRKYDAQLKSTHERCGNCAGVGFTERKRGFKGPTLRVICPNCEGTGWTLKGE